MQRTRVVILANGSVLLSAVARLLDARPDVDLHALPQDSDGLYEQIQDLAPQVIVVEETATGDGAETNIVRLLRSAPQARIVALGVDQPGIEVYRSCRVSRASLPEFLALIAGARKADGRGKRSSDGREREAKALGGPTRG